MYSSNIIDELLVIHKPKQLCILDPFGVFQNFGRLIRHPCVGKLQLSA